MNHTDLQRQNKIQLPREIHKKITHTGEIPKTEQKSKLTIVLGLMTNNLVIHIHQNTSASVKEETALNQEKKVIKLPKL